MSGPLHRGRTVRAGVGRALVAAALGRAAAMPGVRQVYLGGNAGNAAALALYEAMGFTAFGLERGYMLLDGKEDYELLIVHPSDDAVTFYQRAGFRAENDVRELPLRPVVVDGGPRP